MPGDEKKGITTMVNDYEESFSTRSAWSGTKAPTEQARNGRMAQVLKA